MKSRTRCLYVVGLVALLTVALFLAAGSRAAASVTLYSYDPAEAYGGHSWSSTADGLASSFTIPTGRPTFALDELRIRISYTNEPITPVTVSIWENDGGQPGALLWSREEPDVNGPTTGSASYWQWNAFDLSGAPEIPAGTTIFAGYTSDSFAEIAPSWKANSHTMQGIQGSWYRSGSSGDWTSIKLDRMMQLDVIPEPSTIIIWSILGTLALTFGWWRRRRAV